MSEPRHRHTCTGPERLEPRENPSAAWLSEGFDLNPAPKLPTGWATWSNDGSQQFITSKLQAASAPASLASLGSNKVEARTWAGATFPADYGVALSVRSDTAAPIEAIARGDALNTARPTYLAAVARPGGVVELVEDKGGVRTVLGSVKIAQALPAQWLRVSLAPAGGAAGVRVQRADGQYLTGGGRWQAAATDALTKAVAVRTANGSVGVGREAGGNGMAFADDFAVLAPAGVNEAFDTTRPNPLPANWQAWSSDAASRAAVGTARALSPTAALAVDGASNTRARAWLGTAIAADAAASAAVYADNLIPSGVLVRGSNLNSAAPTFYSLTVTRGLTVQVNRVVNGVETPLGTLRSSSYASGQWVKLTLTASGDALRAVVYRQDTGRWLAADGSWSASPEAALTLTDRAIGGGGFVGVDRGRLAAGQVWFDDFEVRPAGSTTGPSVSVTASQAGTTFGGVVTFTAAATPAGSAARVEFTLDGTLRSVQSSAPAGWSLDTTTLRNGAHTLAVRAVNADGYAGTATLAFTAANAGNSTPDRPTGVRKYTHIRIAQLAYAGNPGGAFEQKLAHDSLDLIVANPSLLPTFEAAAADTPKVIYTNVSNLYGGLLTDWLKYADQHGTNRETAFFHVTQATAYSGQSASSVPVNRFTGVYRVNADGSGTPTDLTAEATGGRPKGVAFGGTGMAVVLGWTDRFREVNVALKTAAGGAWQAVYEYVSAVNADGTPKAWSTLPLLSDGTAGLRKDGRITFDPPADWKASTQAGGGQWLYQVRVRSTANGAAPEAKSVFGRDYVNANGGTTGTIPAFDSSADANGDGYLGDAEYAKRRAGYDARFVHESRLFYPYYGPMRFVVNPADLSVGRWAADYHTRLTAANPLADGVFVDNAHGKLPFAGTPVKESTATYTVDSAAVVAAVTRALPGKWVVANTAGSRDEANGIAAASTAAFEEFALRPNDANWATVADLASLVSQRLASDSPSPYLMLDSYPGDGSIADERTRTGTLAYYYLLADPVKTFLTFNGGYSPAAPWSQVWVPAAAVDVGQPAPGGMTAFASGADPQNAKLTYKVLGRQYGNALVLYKPRSYATGQGTGTTADATATTHALGGNYRVLHADGTLGPVVTKITLRNGEGVVLMKA